MTSKIIIALAIAATVAGCPSSSESSSTKATTPKACVEGMIASMEKQDMEAAAAFMTPAVGPKMAKLAKAGKAMEAASEKLATAVDAKFGAGKAEEFGIKQPKGQMEMGKVEIVEVKEEGDKATVKTKQTKKDNTVHEETIDLVKIDGVWYAQPPESSGMNEQQLAKADAMAGAMMAAAKSTEDLAADVTAGKVATKEALQAKQMEIAMGMMKAMMGGGPEDK